MFIVYDCLNEMTMCHVQMTKWEFLNHVNCFNNHPCICKHRVHSQLLLESVNMVIPSVRMSKDWLSRLEPISNYSLDELCLLKTAIFFYAQ